MKAEIPFSKDINLAFKNDPPGQWLSVLPKGCIRLSSGYPEPALVPSEELKSAVVHLLDKEKDLPLQYIGSPKIPELKEIIRKRLAARDVRVSDEELLVTSGACQAIDLVARVLLDDEALVALESPTYMEALEVFRNYTERFMDVPVDEKGLQTEVFEEMLKGRKEQGLPLPRILYVIPTSQNPTGTTMSQERREHVLALAEEYGFFILEDDAYGELGFENNPRLIKSLDKQNRVLHIGSFSKVVAPGMRIGWVAGAEELITTLNWFKKDLHHPFSQSTMAAFLESIDFDGRLKLLSAAYRSKCAVMIKALEEFLPPSVSWYTPEGGYFVWVKVAGIDTVELLPKALAAGVSFVPGKYFFLNPEEGTEFLRLSFSYAGEEEIIQGIRLLGEVVQNTMALK
ncbi:PLP-dependent aminotransferase family protein [Planomicrobium sp. CPCC 101110]|uniref:aminotransferase-like domain-containing protein n=1 Tax=Planomicrobium sp. CPCC 101110 TaxID=2599619 RepID=UPI0011B79CA1|nr:PLP-dependent aminotransferase family protein [Planomicrobium sp. CPCC 101110]TWT25227.1 PLP-dependent aminotransferase family protein [Planomicrobium sp. CPCC 101110]